VPAILAFCSDFGSYCIAVEFFLLPQVFCDQTELLKGRFEIICNLLRKDSGVREVVGFLKAFVSELENVEASLVTANRLVEVIGLLLARKVLLGPSEFANVVGETMPRI
jgi:hypothetical protein